MDVNKNDIGFGIRSWRYSMLIENGIVLKHFIEEEKPGDPFSVSDADTMLKFLNIEPFKNITILTKQGCPFCIEAKELLLKNNLNYTELILEDFNRQSILKGLVNKNTVPQIFIEGLHIGGLDSFKKYLGEK